MTSFHLAFLILFSLSLITQPPPASAASGGSFPAEDYQAGRVPAGTVLCNVVRKHGYKCKGYKVITKDGYILTVHNIFEGRDGGDNLGQPVLLQHGILMDGMVWVANPPEQSLAMILVDKGFDVWISNVRGTRFSRQNRKIPPKDPKFWKWSWDELILDDLPAITDFIFKRTGSEMHYVGHSMGTLMALGSLSERKLTNLKSAALLSPIAYMSHVTTDITLVAARAFIGELGTIVFRMAEFNPRGEKESEFFKVLCALAKVNCHEMKTTAITGKNCCLNQSIIYNFIMNDTQPTSTRNLVHFAQAIRHGFVWRYDYGSFWENVKHYNQVTPPIYNLSNIPRNFPLFISYGGQDKLADVWDVEKLLQDIKSHHKQKLKVQFIKKYAHLDFVLGVDAKDLIYNDIADFFYENE